MRDAKGQEERNQCQGRCAGAKAAEGGVTLEGTAAVEEERSQSQGFKSLALHPEG